MNQNIKNFIEECEKEFDKKYVSETWSKEQIEQFYKQTDEDTQAPFLLEMKQLISSRQISLIKMIMERDIKYWKNIFDNPPKRDKPYPCDNCTQNICRIEIARLEKELKELIKE